MGAMSDAAAGPARARRWAAALLDPSAAAMRRLALAAVLSGAGIVVTGAAVRLSQSGLGCTTWPKCTDTSVVAGGVSGDPLVHRWVEFGNRLVTVAVFAVAVAVLLCAWRFGARRGRRDLIWLAATQPAGIAAQAVLGGVVVLTRLNPVWVALHFALSMVLVAAAVVLHVRSAEPAGPRTALVGPEVRLLAWSLLAVVSVMLAAGTVVTGTGPLAGAPSVPRFHFRLAAVTQLHADIGWLLGGLAVALVLVLRVTGAPAAATRLGWLLLGGLAVQGALGYAQYFAGLPAGLVWVHVSWSVLVWIGTLRLVLALRGPLGQAREDAPRPAADRQVKPGSERAARPADDAERTPAS
jgi:cytochrome c oxidase assembly protein subunit 15